MLLINTAELSAKVMKNKILISGGKAENDPDGGAEIKVSIARSSDEKILTAIAIAAQ